MAWRHAFAIAGGIFSAVGYTVKFIAGGIFSAVGYTVKFIVEALLAEDEQEKPKKRQSERCYEQSWEPQKYQRSDDFDNFRFRGYGRSDHDDEKIQHSTQEEAEVVIDRMRSQGKDPDGNLNSYYNSDYGRWFVGNSKRKRY